MALQTIAAAGIALWPIYAGARAAKRVESPLRPTLWFVAGGFVLGGGMALFTPWLAELASGGKIELNLGLIVAFVIFVVLQAAKYPIGMYMTDARGLWFQAIPTVIMIPISVVLAFWLIPLIGATGAVVSTSAAVLVCQVIPNFLYVRYDMARRGESIDEPVVT